MKKTACMLQFPALNQLEKDKKKYASKIPSIICALAIRQFQARMSCMRLRRVT